MEEQLLKDGTIIKFNEGNHQYKVIKAKIKKPLAKTK